MANLHRSRPISFLSVQEVSPKGNRASGIIILKPHHNEFSAIVPFENKAKEALSSDFGLVVNIRELQDLRPHIVSTRIAAKGMFSDVKKEDALKLLNLYFKLFNYSLRLSFWAKNAKEDFSLVELHAYPSTIKGVPFSEPEIWFLLNGTSIFFLRDFYGEFGKRLERGKNELSSLKSKGYSNKKYFYFLSECSKLLDSCFASYEKLSRFRAQMKLVELPGYKEDIGDSSPHYNFYFDEKGNLKVEPTTYEKWYVLRDICPMSSLLLSKEKGQFLQLLANIPSS